MPRLFTMSAFVIKFFGTVMAIGSGLVLGPEGLPLPPPLLLLSLPLLPFTGPKMFGVTATVCHCCFCAHCCLTSATFASTAVMSHAAASTAAASTAITPIACAGPLIYLGAAMAAGVSRGVKTFSFSIMGKELFTTTLSFPWAKRVFANDADRRDFVAIGVLLAAVRSRTC